MVPKMAKKNEACNLLRERLSNAGYLVKSLNVMDLGVSLDARIQDWGVLISAYKDGENGSCSGRFRHIRWHEIEEDGVDPLNAAIGELVKWGLGK